MLVEKTTVYLDEVSLAAIKRLARAQGRAEAELIREAVARYVAGEGRPALKSLGIVRGAGDLAARTERLLAEGFGKVAPPERALPPGKPKPRARRARR
jgi:hypothetical protein